MSLFISDRKSDSKLLETSNNSSIYTTTRSLEEAEPASIQITTPNTFDGEDDDDFGGLPPPSQDISHIIKQFRDGGTTKSKKWDEFKAPENARVADEVNHFVTRNLESRQTDLKTFSESERKLKKLGKIERSKSAGSGWFNLPATEITEEVKNDLEILKMRSALDPKHFYKRSEKKGLPKFFQIGKVLENPLDYYQDRDEKKVKSKSLVEELLQDAEFQKFTKRKYQEAVKAKKTAGYKKAHAKMKKLKKK